MNALIQKYEEVCKNGDDAVESFVKGLNLDQVKAGFSLILGLLNSDHEIFVKNAAAIALRDLGDDRAVPELLKAAQDSRNKGKIGTFIYSLQTLKCNSILIELAEFIIEGVYEVVEMAYQALEEVKPPVDVQLARAAKKLVVTAKLLTAKDDFRYPYLRNSQRKLAELCIETTRLIC